MADRRRRVKVVSTAAQRLCSPRGDQPGPPQPQTPADLRYRQPADYPAAHTPLALMSISSIPRLRRDCVQSPTVFLARHQELESLITDNRLRKEVDHTLGPDPGRKFPTTASTR